MRPLAGGQGWRGRRYDKAMTTMMSAALPATAHVRPIDAVGIMPKGLTDTDGEPFSLTEEFVSVYRMHTLIPDHFTLVSADTGAVPGGSIKIGGRSFEVVSLAAGTQTVWLTPADITAVIEVPFLVCALLLVSFALLSFTSRVGRSQRRSCRSLG